MRAASRRGVRANGEHAAADVAWPLTRCAGLQHYVVAHEGNRTRASVAFNVRVTYPAESDDAQGAFVGGGGAGDYGAGTSAPPPKLSFTVPAHHQRDFLNEKMNKDMRVS